MSDTTPLQNPPQHPPVCLHEREWGAIFARIDNVQALAKASEDDREKLHGLVNEDKTTAAVLLETVKALNNALSTNHAGIQQELSKLRYQLESIKIPSDTDITKLIDPCVAKLMEQRPTTEMVRNTIAIELASVEKRLKHDFRLIYGTLVVCGVILGVILKLLPASSLVDVFGSP